MARAANNESRKGRISILALIFRVILRGEFRLKPTIILMSVYGAAILVIPVVLNSAFSLSAGYLGVGNQSLLLSMYSEIKSSYLYIEALLFTGLIITCFLSGMTIGRRTRISQSLLSHLGVQYEMLRRVILLVLLAATLLSMGLAFSLSIILSSASLYVISLLFNIPYSIFSIDSSILIYALLLNALAYVSLSLGWTRTGENVFKLEAPLQGKQRRH